MKNAARILMLLALPGCASAVADSKALHTGAPDTRSTTDYAVAAERTDAPVIIAPEVLHGFSFLYQYVSETEFVLCLEGTQKRGRIYVSGFRLAVMTKTTINTASYEPCLGSDYVGTAHNHPPEPGGSICAQSPPDRISFYNDSRAVVDIVICGRTRYLWVLKDGRSDIDDGMSRLRELLAKSVHN